MPNQLQNNSANRKWKNEFKNHNKGRSPVRCYGNDEGDRANCQQRQNWPNSAVVQSGGDKELSVSSENFFVALHEHCRWQDGVTFLKIGQN